MNKINLFLAKCKKFFIRLLNIPCIIYIEYDRNRKVFYLWEGKKKEEYKHTYTTFRALKGGVYNTIVSLKSRPVDFVCKRRIFNRLFEPEQNVFKT